MMSSTTMHIAHSPAMFVGIPWVACGADARGADCWGLVRIAAHDLFGLVFPPYFYSAEDLLDEAAALIERETTQGARWVSVAGPEFAPGCVHIFRIKGLKTHCGLALERGDFLHSLPGHESAIENLASIQWRQRRTGTYQWQPMPT